MQNLITDENYKNYLTHHGQSIETAQYVVEKWKDYEGNEAIRIWVEASIRCLNQN